MSIASDPSLRRSRREHRLGEAADAVAGDLGRRPVGCCSSTMCRSADARRRREPAEQAVGADAPVAVAERRPRRPDRDGCRRMVGGERDEEVVAESVVLGQSHVAPLASLVPRRTTGRLIGAGCHATDPGRWCRCEFRVTPTTPRAPRRPDPAGRRRARRSGDPDGTSAPGGRRTVGSGEIACDRHSSRVELAGGGDQELLVAEGLRGRAGPALGTGVEPLRPRRRNPPPSGRSNRSSIRGRRLAGRSMRSPIWTTSVAG